MTFEELTFAIDVLQYREQQRKARAQKEQEWQSQAKLHQARMQSLYGIDPPKPSVSTPPLKRDIYPLVEPLDTKNNSSEPKDSEYINSSPNTLEKLKPCLELLEEIINQGQEVIKQILVQFLVSEEGQRIVMVAQNYLLDWLVKFKKLITV